MDEHADYNRHVIFRLSDKPDTDVSSAFSVIAKFLQDYETTLEGPLNIPEFESAELRLRVYYLQSKSKDRAPYPSAALVDWINNMPSMVQRYGTDDGKSKAPFEYVTRNAPVELAAITDPRAGEQWAWDKIDAGHAWACAARFVSGPLTKPVRVGIVDSGVMKAHEDLPGAQIRCFSVPPTGSHDDAKGHGTMLAGTIAALAGNPYGGVGALGPFGAAGMLELLAVKFIDGRTVPHALNGAIGIIRAVLEGADVINLSWDVGIDAGRVIDTAIWFAGLRGCLVVIAAGNDGTDNTKLPTFPACYVRSNVLSVLATEEDDDKAYFSNFGTNVHLGAPGQRIVSTFPYHSARNSPVPANRFDPAYHKYSGTSAAAAHATGAAALLLIASRAANPMQKWAPSDLRDHLMASTDRCEPLKKLCASGGRLNLGRALCGPLSVQKPLLGSALAQGSVATAEWKSDYPTPAVMKVKVSLVDRATGNVTVLGTGRPTTGKIAFNVPHTPTNNAVISVESEQKSLFIAESGQFRIY